MHPVIALVTAGVEMDVLAIAYGDYSAAERSAVVHAHPRAVHFKEDIIQAFLRWHQRKPMCSPTRIRPSSPSISAVRFAAPPGAGDDAARRGRKSARSRSLTPLKALRGCSQGRGSAAGPAAFCPHSLVNDRKIATAGTGPTPYLPVPADIVRSDGHEKRCFACSSGCGSRRGSDACERVGAV